MACKKYLYVAPHAYYVHCASHNVKLALTVAMEAMTDIGQFYDTIDPIYNFFGHSVVRWLKLQNVYNYSFSNPTLKALNLIQWSGRYMYCCYAYKERFYDFMICLTHIILTSTRSKKNR